MVNKNKLFVAPADLAPFEDWEIEPGWKIGIRRCFRCGHKWITQSTDAMGELLMPRVCPDCHSVYWNVRRNPKGKVGK
jgi:ribosomal protein L31